MCTERRFRSFLLFAAAVLGNGVSLCGVGCSGGDGDTGIDTDFEFGETTPCVNEARPGEVCVPGGKYLMGCVPGDTECEENEKPLVAVTLSPFFVDRKEATIADVIDWMNDVKDDPGFVTDPYFAWTDGTELYQIWGTSWHVGLDVEDSVSIVLRDTDGNYYFNAEAANGACPNQGGIEAAAGGFSWLGAKLFCEWKGMQLPTEAQWEAAARGQTFHEFPCGSDLAECWWGVYACCNEGWTCGSVYSNLCHCCAPFSADHADTCLSPFGLSGMYGNAYEWTNNYLDDGHQECTEGCVDPAPEAPASSTTAHLAKGGSLGSNQAGLRISSRSADSSYADNGSSDTGVRCVRPDELFVPPDAGNDEWK